MAANPIPEAVRAQAVAWFAEYDKANHFPEMLATDAYAAGYASAQQQQGGGEVCAEDLRWCEDIAESLREAGGPTNNMRLVALNRLLRHARAAPPIAPVGVEWTDERIIAVCKAAGVRWIEADEEEGGFPGGFDITHMPEMRRLFTALAQQPAAAPCCMCGNPVDTRENGTPGAELTDGRWTCSHECFDKATAQHQEPTTTRP